MNKKDNQVEEVDSDIERLDKELTAEYNKHIKKVKRRKYIKKNSEFVGRQSRFCKKMFERYDTPARKKLKEVLGDYITDNPDIYGQDFLINSNTCKYNYLEVQVCADWINEYPYSKVWIYERKSKYNYDSTTLFLTFNKRLSRGYFFDIDSIKEVKPRRLKKYSREYVYDIPWNRIMEFGTSMLDKETVELY